jgi:hypothetical protein
MIIASHGSLEIAGKFMNNLMADKTERRGLEAI